MTTRRETSLRGARTSLLPSSRRSISTGRKGSCTYRPDAQSELPPAASESREGEPHVEPSAIPPKLSSSQSPPPPNSQCLATSSFSDCIWGNFLPFFKTLLDALSNGLLLVECVFRCSSSAFSDAKPVTIAKSHPSHPLFT